MKASDAIRHFGSGAEVARRLKLRSRATVSWWKQNGDLVPELHARRLHELTRGKLKFDRSAYEEDSQAA